MKLLEAVINFFCFYYDATQRKTQYYQNINLNTDNTWCDNPKISHTIILGGFAFQWFAKVTIILVCIILNMFSCYTLSRNMQKRLFFKLLLNHGLRRNVYHLELIKSLSHNIFISIIKLVSRNMLRIW